MLILLTSKTRFSKIFVDLPRDGILVQQIILFCLAQCAIFSEKKLGFNEIMVGYGEIASETFHF